MPRAKPYQPYNPNKPHDRRSNDLLRNAEVAAIEVDCPMAQPHEPATLVVMRSIRNDPLAALHSRRHIDEAQYQGGRAFQHDFETAERGPQAIDPSKEHVDGGRAPEPITEAQQRAAKHLAVIYRRLGADGSALAHDVLIHGKTYGEVAVSRGVGRQRRWEEYFGMRFQECLHRLALIYGFATACKGITPGTSVANLTPGANRVHMGTIK